jgi:CheY-like chemotaxis protein
MSSKRALVVDDSKSARAFLSRILERHEIAVDAAESAEAAIDYLTRNRPDVIFMDHMMPGMDGFQAVQTIKNNPRTAQIPILMYTSQEGDLYLGQARALGAEGVLPKQIKQADVTKLLFDLRLVAERRTGDYPPLAALAPVTEGIRATPPALSLVVSNDEPAKPEKSVEKSESPPEAPRTDIAALMPQLTLEIRAAIDTRLQNEIEKLQSYIGTKLDSHTERLHGDLSALLPAPRVPEVDHTPLVPERRIAGAVGWTVALLASAGAAALGWLWWSQGGEIAALRTDLSAAYAELETLRERELVRSSAPEPVVPVAVDPAALPLAPEAGSTDSAVVPVPADAAAAAPTPAAAAAEPAPAAPAVTFVPATTPTPVAAPTR